MPTITGMCVSPGKTRGRLRFYKKNIRYKKADIVMLNEWVTTNVAYLKNAGGLLSNLGGLTCHASIIAREYGLPCLVSLRNSKQLKDGAKIELDATG